MKPIFKKLALLLIGQPPKSSQAVSVTTPLSSRQLIQKESDIGRELFGSTPRDHSREFFCLDAQTWILYEQWRDQRGVPISSTTRYETHPKGILKVSGDGKEYHFLGDGELEDFAAKTQQYLDKVKTGLYA